jgi:hypothetical protein
MNLNKNKSVLELCTVRKLKKQALQRCSTIPLLVVILQPFEGYSSPLARMVHAFTPSDDYTNIQIWEVSTGKEIQTPPLPVILMELAALPLARMDRGRFSSSSWDKPLSYGRWVQERNSHTSLKVGHHSDAKLIVSPRSPDGQL